ncbi:MAG: hypothetical protein WA655_10430 [Candidatus Korobacteraceae bacterium]
MASGGGAVVVLGEALGMFGDALGVLGAAVGSFGALLGVFGIVLGVFAGEFGVTSGVAPGWVVPAFGVLVFAPGVVVVAPGVLCGIVLGDVLCAPFEPPAAPCPAPAPADCAKAQQLHNNTVPVKSKNLRFIVVLASDPSEISKWLPKLRWDDEARRCPSQNNWELPPKPVTFVDHAVRARRKYNVRG